MRTLVAGFGNELRGDDGFGVEVVRRLREGVLPDGVDVIEVGTAGIRLAQELLTRYDRLVIVDATTRGASPGTVYVSEVESVEAATEVDPHVAVPARALGVAKALGALPGRVFIVGCEPGEVDELTTELTPPVRAAVDVVLAHVRRLIGDSRPADPLAGLERRDEILQVTFWLQGEGFGPDVALADIMRFLDDEAAVAMALAQLVEDGYLEAVGTDGSPTRYRLTPLGEREGRRRFLDEFEPFLARGGHGECGFANCDCHQGGECRGTP